MILVFGVSWVFTHAGLNYVGYCSGKGRVLSDEEKIAAAVRIINGVSFISSESFPELKNSETECKYNEFGSCNVIPYKTVEEFLEKNPDCCTVSYLHSESERFCQSTREQRFFGASSCVNVVYNANYFDKNGKRQSILTKGLVHLDVCGNDISN